MGLNNISFKKMKWVYIILLLVIFIYFIFIINKPKCNRNQKISLHPASYSSSSSYSSSECKPTIPRVNNMDMDMRKDIDRQYLVDEDPELLPANEVNKMNYKGWMNEEGKCNQEMNEELYTTDEPLFDLKGPINLIPLDINGQHRRVNFY